MEHAVVECEERASLAVALDPRLGRLVAAVASFETRAKPHHRRTLRQLHAGKLERNMADAELKAADACIDDHFLRILHPEQRPSLEWFLDMSEVAVARHGARIIQVDPWNRLEAARGQNESETEYIGRCLRTLHTFAHDMNCHVQVIAHPSKMDATRKGKAPELEDISGSKNWDNMVDQGFVVHRPKFFEDGERQTEAEFLHRKAHDDSSQISEAASRAGCSRCRAYA